MKAAISLLLFLPFCVKSQVTTYTLTPNSNLSFTFQSTGGQASIRPSNSVFLQYSRDSQKVQIVNIYDKSFSIMNVADSIIHFYTGSFHFVKKASLDSFYINILCK